MWSRRGIIQAGLIGIAGLSGILATIKILQAKIHRHPVVEFPHPILRQPAQPIDTIDEGVIQLAQRMIATLKIRALPDFLMKASLPRGLSAPQIGVSKRLTVCGLHGELKVLVNPAIVEKSGTYPNREYCLSLPDHPTRTLQRSETIRIQYLDLQNRPQTLVAARGSAGLLEHEIDHLNGILYIDRI
jgi:peptide deformylase